MSPRHRGPRARDLGPGELREAPASRACDERSRTGFWKSCCSLFPSKIPPTLAWLHTNDNFFCALPGSRFWAWQVKRGCWSSRGGSAACPASRWAQTQGSPAAPTSRAANSPARMKKRAFNKNFNDSVTKTVLIATVYRAPAFKAHVLCPPGKPSSF